MPPVAFRCLKPYNDEKQGAVSPAQPLYQKPTAGFLSRGIYRAEFAFFACKAGKNGGVWFSRKAKLSPVLIIPMLHG